MIKFGWKTAVKGAAVMILVAISIGLNACSVTVAPTLSPSTPTAPLVEEPGAFIEPVGRGAGLYIANCQMCHGDQQGKGGVGAPPHNQRGHTWHHPDAQLKDWVINGKLGFAQMPGFKETLTESEIDEILTYIKTWWVEEQRETQADISRRYQEALDKQKRGQ